MYNSMSIKTYKIVSIVVWLMLALSGIGLVWAFLYDISYLRLFAFVWISLLIGLIATNFVFDILND